ncbi:hypothetical protein [Gordoniibacillus kamchatkensis]|uniref:hypothetical protein n=1 Tax=Gordoniibacillus kamchatkensis TaxID=1590651 RepID=UPI00069841AA|nr:hypothetical protein [Paenibacillus sp. VKM B-2647]
MYSDSDKRESELPPRIRGRLQFEQETGARHADEEYAAELAPQPGSYAPRQPDVRAGGEEEERDGPLETIGALVADEGEVVAANRSLGIVAVVLAAISLFFLPAILGPAAVVVGFAAYVRGNRALGMWSMALGLLAVAAYYVLVPYYT